MGCGSCTLVPVSPTAVVRSHSPHLKKKQVSAAANETVITEGETTGDHFYIIERGEFSVVVGEKVVATLNDGQSFGELALVTNAPRSATVTAVAKSNTLWTIDRRTFRGLLAKESSGQRVDIISALETVPLLRELTNRQLGVLAQAVVPMSFNKGDTIIRRGEVSRELERTRDGGDAGRGGGKLGSSNEPIAKPISACHEAMMFFLVLPTINAFIM